MKSVCRNLGAALGRIILAPHSVAPIEIVTPICSAEVVIHRHLHGFPGRLPSLPSAACVYPEIRSTGRGVRPDSLSAVKSGSSPFSTFIPSKVGGGIGTFGLRCGASERTHSGMDGSAESNPAAGLRNFAEAMWHRGLKRKAKSAHSPYAVMWVPEGMPLQSSYPNAGSVKTTSRRMRRMELRRQFRVSEKGIKREEIKESLRCRDQMRIARWRAGVHRVKEWKDLLAVSGSARAVPVAL